MEKSHWDQEDEIWRSNVLYEPQAMTCRFEVHGVHLILLFDLHARGFSLLLGLKLESVSSRDLDI